MQVPSEDETEDEDMEGHPKMGVTISSQTRKISFLQILLEQHATNTCSFTFTFFHA